MASLRFDYGALPLSPPRHCDHIGVINAGGSVCVSNFWRSRSARRRSGAGGGGGIAADGEPAGGLDRVALPFADPREGLLVVYGTAAPGDLLKYYREQVQDLVYGALVDSRDRKSPLPLAGEGWVRVGAASRKLDHVARTTLTPA